eukprot:2444847-Pyramimonas_sp.AAC.1
MEQFQPPPSAQAHALSIGIGNGAFAGGQANWTIIDSWIDQSRHGQVAALSGGPPRETWSAANNERSTRCPLAAMTTV